MPGWRGLIAALMVGLGCAVALGGEGFTFTHTLSTGETRSYPARIDRPEAGIANGYSVLLIGGGYGWDLHWTVVGSYEDAGGERVLVTIDGEPTRDADRIGDVLLGAGYTVLRWASVFEGDPRFDAATGAMTPIGVAESSGLTRSAIEAFRARGGFEAGKLVLLGHSLGASRACVVAEREDVAGFVLLAGAYLSPTRARPSVLSREALERHGDADGVIGRGEFGGALVGDDTFGSVDRDGDGLLRGWELAALDRSRGVIAIDDGDRVWTGDGRWPSAGLVETRRPVLALFGGLDPISVHGPWLEAASVDGRLPDCTVRYFAGLGHQLGREVDGRVGPIADRVLDAVVDWLAETIVR